MSDTLDKWASKKEIEAFYKKTPGLQLTENRKRKSIAQLREELAAGGYLSGVPATVAEPTINIIGFQSDVPQQYPTASAAEVELSGFGGLSLNTPAPEPEPSPPASSVSLPEDYSRGKKVAEMRDFLSTHIPNTNIPTKKRELREVYNEIYQKINFPEPEPEPVEEEAVAGPPPPEAVSSSSSDDEDDLEEDMEEDEFIPITHEDIEYMYNKNEGLLYTSSFDPIGKATIGKNEKIIKLGKLATKYHEEMRVKFENKEEREKISKMNLEEKKKYAYERAFDPRKTSQLGFERFSKQYPELWELIDLFDKPDRYVFAIKHPKAKRFQNISKYVYDTPSGGLGAEASYNIRTEFGGFLEVRRRFHPGFRLRD